VRAQPDAIVVADGTSCRHQIHDGAKREAVHLSQLLASLLPSRATLYGSSQRKLKHP
jgi:Fe-S oxidoreductase